ncbi:zinc finger, CCHC-type, Retrotransposon gag domain protein [Artemisia annua]|uniref:Zinc finger, CCHC-type, Retrotransposon gag domain protein n=1 Tax=Artemisia annua TaxID=35608 RepID=A0A2U1P482_ARTAN|nr:zinc finger, CCHC-type, Retrotransposon gag domain protein [Artemisia annua]
MWVFKEGNYRMNEVCGSGGSESTRKPRKVVGISQRLYYYDNQVLCQQVSFAVANDSLYEETAQLRLDKFLALELWLLAMFRKRSFHPAFSPESSPSPFAADGPSQLSLSVPDIIHHSYHHCPWSWYRSYSSRRYDGVSLMYALTIAVSFELQETEMNQKEHEIDTNRVYSESVAMVSRRKSYVNNRRCRGVRIEIEEVSRLNFDGTEMPASDIPTSDIPTSDENTTGSNVVTKNGRFTRDNKNNFQLGVNKLHVATPLKVLFANYVFVTTLYNFRFCDFGTTCNKRVENATCRNSILGYMDGIGNSHVIHHTTISIFTWIAQHAVISDLDRAYRIAMVTTRTQDEFANNPAFEAAVQQSVNALLPRIQEEMREDVCQEMANGAGTSGGGGNPPESIHTWLEWFNKQKPHSLSTVTSPDDTEHWIAHMEKIFEVLGCGDIFKARLAMYKFEGEALNWWKAYKYAKGGDNPNEYVATLSWASFREIFRSQYFPLSEKEKYEREYHTIAMTDRETSTEFMKRFAGTQAEQAKKFKWALRQDLLNGVVNLHFDDVAGVANAVHNIEIAVERVKQGVKMNYDGEPVQPAQGNAQRGNEFRGNDRRVFDTRGSDRQGYDRRGYDNRGYDRRNDRRGYDARGYDRQGNNYQRAGRDQQQQGQQD